MSFCGRLLCPYLAGNCVFTGPFHGQTAGLSKRQYLWLITVELILFSLPSMIPGIESFNPEGGNGLIWFIVLYTIGAFFRLYPVQRIDAWKWMLSLLAIVVMTFILSETIMSLAMRYSGSRQGGSRVASYTTVFFVSASICLFHVFLNINVPHKVERCVLTVSPLCFGIYLIHEHPLLREHIWSFIGLGNYANHWWITFATLGVSVVVFTACGILEWLRQRLFINIAVDSIVGKIDVSFNQKVSGLSSNQKE